MKHSIRSHMRSVVVLFCVVGLSLMPLLSSPPVWAQTTSTQGSTQGASGSMGTTGAVQGAAGASTSILGMQSQTLTGTGSYDSSGSAQLAMATPEYPVTPGDIYGLTYTLLTTIQSSKVIVEGDGTLSLGFFGKFNTTGMTFRALKATIEAKVQAAYPQSSPSLVIISTGTFPVKVQGQIQSTTEIKAWGLTRLHEVVYPLVTPYSSLRDVKVRNQKGVETSYDLFKAEREGDTGQDPVVRPGDVVTVGKASRRIVLDGEVRRPGTYQLKDGEGVSELLSYYGDGTLASAKVELVVLTHKASAEKPESESVVFDATARDLPALLDGDSVHVPSREEYLPVVYVEGAVAGDLLASSNKDQTVTQTNYALIRVKYREGLTVATLLRPMKEKLLSSGDLKQAFIIHKSGAAQTPVDLEKLLYTNDLSGDVKVEPEDRIIIPFGSMYVFVTGEVTKSSWVPITGLTRLQDVVVPLVTHYSSSRDVKVTSAQGVESSYDLFKAERFGDLSQNPFLMPGDTIQVLSDVNQVTIQGEVKRPGTYQLLKGEGLKELVEYYADGFTEKANPSRVSLVRYSQANNPVGEKQQFDFADNKNLVLNSYDVVTVPAMQELLPVLWFEGAVGVGTAGPSPETSQRIAYTFFPGETISQAAITNRKLFSPISDLPNAYIVRAGKQIPVNLSKFIYDYDLQGDFALEPNDTVVVPFRQFFVTVSGAVRIPGRYPYIPNRSWEYYVGLAGGFDTDRNSGQAITIRDVNSKKMPKEGRLIQPEDNIEAASNSWIYNFTKVSTIVSTLFTTIVVVMQVINLFK